MKIIITYNLKYEVSMANQTLASKEDEGYH